MLSAEKKLLDGGSESRYTLAVCVSDSVRGLSPQDFYTALLPYSGIDTSSGIRQIELVNNSSFPASELLQYLLTAMRNLVRLYFNPVIFSPNENEWILKSNLDARNNVIGNLLSNSHSSIRVKFNSMHRYLAFVDSLVGCFHYVPHGGSASPNPDSTPVLVSQDISFFQLTPRQRTILNLIIKSQDGSSLSLNDAVCSLLQTQLNDCHFKEDWPYVRSTIRFQGGAPIVTEKTDTFIYMLFHEFNGLPIKQLLTCFLRDVNGERVTLHEVERYFHLPCNFDVLFIQVIGGEKLVANVKTFLEAGPNLGQDACGKLGVLSLINMLYFESKALQACLPDLLGMVGHYAKQQGVLDVTMATIPIAATSSDQFPSFYLFLENFFQDMRMGWSFGFDTAFSRAAMLIGEAASVLCDVGASPNAVPNPVSGLTLIGQAMLYLGIMTYVVANPETTLEDLPPDLAALFERHFSKILKLCATDKQKALFWESYTAQMTAEYRPNTIKRINRYVSVLQSCIKKNSQQGVSPGLFAKSAALPAIQGGQQDMSDMSLKPE